MSGRCSNADGKQTFTYRVDDANTKVDANTIRLEMEYDRTLPLPQSRKRDSFTIKMDDVSRDGGHRFVVEAVEDDATRPVGVGDCYAKASART